ncbi:MAG: Membrane protein insertase YidC [Candidatus Magasanikbacteria bacterium GW2011_GWA2_37_8]|uniref:Membrane protein insertase YidC n=1 Tax=Candidatus Magasanikbacteria bacterium GW2011_GWA2_37_8 TaxID=1619036 RepID=A0A0G0HKN7_9BACT|nr:MAG: Membrane protein insertase YidC [Candidatus Magasanikbacteria bacterium GW2011_GWA2_37_8]
MLSTIWFIFLYQPLFNALIWIYSNIADFNLGWAVIWLTIFLRILLLPLTFITERNSIRQEKAEEEALAESKAFEHDSVARSEIIRKVMKKHKISPWAKVLTLLIQLLVLVLLYQVFIRGISGDKIVKILYNGIDFPGKINTIFYGFEVGKVHDAIWAGITALYLFFSIIIENRKSKIWQPSQVTFLLIFPLFTFFALWLLPMVKSLFILTSMIFSDIIHILRMIFFPAPKVEKK